jgi:hypothetical protein
VRARSRWQFDWFNGAWRMLSASLPPSSRQPRRHVGHNRGDPGSRASRGKAERSNPRRTAATSGTSLRHNRRCCRPGALSEILSPLRTQQGADAIAFRAHSVGICPSGIDSRGVLSATRESASATVVVGTMPAMGRCRPSASCARDDEAALPASELGRYPSDHRRRRDRRSAGAPALLGKTGPVEAIAADPTLWFSNIPTAVQIASPTPRGLNEVSALRGR